MRLATTHVPCLLALLALGVGLLLPMSAPRAANKPPPSSSMFESTREPASAEESAAVMNEIKSKWSAIGPALFVRGYLTDRVGMSLYVFDRDRPGVSTCYRACEKLWPPLLAELEDEPIGEFGIIDRLYGARQWTWRDQPLYYWPSDSKPGDRTGDNVSGVWHLILEPESADAESKSGTSAAVAESAEPDPAGAAELPGRPLADEAQFVPAPSARDNQEESLMERATERRLQRERERSEYEPVR